VKRSGMNNSLSVEHEAVGRRGTSYWKTVTGILEGKAVHWSRAGSQR